MTAQEFNDLLAALATQAPALRRAGVSRMKVADVEVELIPEAERAPGPAKGLFDGDPIDDPATFGGRLPTYGRE